jgi:hypothetical protein
VSTYNERSITGNGSDNDQTYGIANSATSQSQVVSDIPRSQGDRKPALIQAKSGLQGLKNRAELALTAKLSFCIPIVVAIIDSIDVR